MNSKMQLEAISKNGYNKITTGWVKQVFGPDGKCVSQEFVAGESEYEVETAESDGDTITGTALAQVQKNETYQPFDMVQPNDKKINDA